MKPYLALLQDILDNGVPKVIELVREQCRCSVDSSDNVR